jgi:Ni2+-binding GTPase involved in maturation of urease and hydrogenase
VFDFDIDKLRDNVAPLNDDISIYLVSALNGDGFDDYIAELIRRIEDEGH